MVFPDYFSVIEENNTLRNKVYALSLENLRLRAQLDKLSLHVIRMWRRIREDRASLKATVSHVQRQLLQLCKGSKVIDSGPVDGSDGSHTKTNSDAEEDTGFDYVTYVPDCTDTCCAST